MKAAIQLDQPGDQEEAEDVGQGESRRYIGKHQCQEEVQD